MAKKLYVRSPAPFSTNGVLATVMPSGMSTLARVAAPALLANAKVSRKATMERMGCSPGRIRGPSLAFPGCRASPTYRLKAVQVKILAMLRLPAASAQILFLGILSLCGQASADPGADYARIYATHDFFALRAMVAADKSPDSEQKRFYTAAMLTAFNQPAAANRIIEPMLANNIDTALMPFLLQMRLENDRHLYDYAGALDTERTLI